MNATFTGKHDNTPDKRDFQPIKRDNRPDERDFQPENTTTRPDERDSQPKNATALRSAPETTQRRRAGSQRSFA
jgi:hypothetical protein